MKKGAENESPPNVSAHYCFDRKIRFYWTTAC